MKRSTEQILTWITFGILLLSTALSVVAIFVGSIDFSNPLPQNPFDNKSKLVMLIIAPFQLIAVIWALKHAFKMFFGEDWVTVTYDKQGREVERDHFDGCITQLMVAIGTPLLAGVITYMVLYYVIFFFMQLGSFLLPFLIPTAMLVVSLLFGWRMLRNPKEEPVPEVIEKAETTEAAEPEVNSWMTRLEDLIITYKRPLISTILTLIYLASAIALLHAGFGSQEEKSTEEDFTVEVDPHHRIIKKFGKSYFICDYGKAGSLQLGAPFVDRSSSDEGLYNRIERKEIIDSNGKTCRELNLYMNDEHVGRLFLNPTNPILNAYTIFTDRVSLPNGIHPGMKLNKAMETDEVYATATYYPEKGEFGVTVTSCGRDLLTEEEALQSLSEYGMEHCQKELSASNRWLRLGPKDFKKSTKVTRLHVYMDI